MIYYMPMLIINISRPQFASRIEIVRSSGNGLSKKRWQSSSITLLGLGCHGKPDESLFVPIMQVAYSITNCFSSHSQFFIDRNKKFKTISINYLPCTTQSLRLSIKVFPRSVRSASLLMSSPQDKTSL